MNLLHIDASPLGGQSVSRLLTRETVQAWTARHPGTTVEYLDVAANPPGHLDMDSLGFRLGIDAADLTEDQRQENRLSERLVTQFLAADVVVIGAPMYNFGVPSQLKAWIDRIAQAGRTFRYTEKGPQGLAGGKTVIVVSTRGGVHSTAPFDHHEDYLRQFFGFLGVTDVRIVRAEGLAMGDAAKAKALESARADIDRSTAIQADTVAA